MCSSCFIEQALAVHFQEMVNAMGGEVQMTTNTTRTEAVRQRRKEGWCMTEKNGRYCRFVADHPDPCFCTWDWQDGDTNEEGEYDG